MSIVEATSGNTGIGLAMVAAAKGYKCIIIMPQVPPMTERYLACRHFGAQVVLTAAGLGVKGMLELVESYKKKPKEFFCTEQFDNSNNPNAHELTTAPEVQAKRIPPPPPAPCPLPAPPPLTPPLIPPSSASYPFA